jgi:peptide deformylase
LSQKLKIVQAGDPVLRQIARPLSRVELIGREVQELIEQMRETMRDAPGVGLAAPQVGVSLQLAVIEDREEYHAALSEAELRARNRSRVDFHVLANPTLTLLDAGPLEFYEGCLSVSGFLAKVPRAARVRVDALDHRGDAFSLEATGWYARILQHEIDHLRGTLYLDRMDPRTFSTQPNYLRFVRPGEQKPGT